MKVLMNVRRYKKEIEPFLISKKWHGVQKYDGSGKKVAVMAKFNSF